MRFEEYMQDVFRDLEVLLRFSEGDLTFSRNINTTSEDRLNDYFQTLSFQGNPNDDEYIIRVSGHTLLGYLTVDEIKSVCIRALRSGETVQDSFEGFYSDSGNLLKKETFVQLLHAKISGRVRNIFVSMISIDIETVNRLSSMFYEGARTHGTLWFTAQNRDILKCFGNDAIQTPQGSNILWSRETLRHISKLMAGTNEALLFGRKDSSSPYEFFAYVKNSYCVNKALTWIRIDGIYQWTLFSQSTPLFSFKHNYVQKPINEVQATVDSISSIWKITSDHKECLSTWLEKAISAAHGMSVIFCDPSMETMNSFISHWMSVNRANQIDPPISVGLDNDFSFSLARIDGAIIINPHTMEMTHYGVLVDGRAEQPGRLDQGSRHNSMHLAGDLIRKAKSDKKSLENVVMAIFSEDGGVDLSHI